MAFGYRKWLTKRIEELNQGADVIQTKNGPVELERRGAAPYVLFFHSESSGYDSSFLNDHLVEAGLGCLSPSRPGHLRTPLSTGRIHAEQADAMAALLDAIGVEQVAVHGVSAGGPSAIQFAARHPDRTSALLLTSAITTDYPYDFPVWGRVAVGSNVGSWLTLLFSEKFPKIMLGEGAQAYKHLFERRTETNGRQDPQHSHLDRSLSHADDQLDPGRVAKEWFLQ